MKENEKKLMDLLLLAGSGVEVELELLQNY
jgi:hypothetical protein